MEFKNRNRNTNRNSPAQAPAPSASQNVSPTAITPPKSLLPPATPVSTASQAPTSVPISKPAEQPIPVPDKRSRSAIKPKIKVYIRRSKDIKIDPKEVGSIDEKEHSTPRSFRNAIITTVVIILLASGYFIYKSQSEQPGVSSNNNSVAVSGPDFKTLVPDGKTVQLLGGWKLVSPPGKPPTYAFNDKINDIEISVSQSVLPEQDQTDPDKKVTEIAKSFNATKKLQTRYSTVYMGNSAKGPQSLIFVKNNTLILIKSADVISDESWEKYIDSLNFVNPDKLPSF